MSTCIKIIEHFYEGHVYTLEKRQDGRGSSYWIGLIDSVISTSPEVMYLDVIRILAPGYRNHLYEILENLILEELGLEIDDDN